MHTIRSHPAEKPPQGLGGVNSRHFANLESIRSSTASSMAFRYEMPPYINSDSMPTTDSFLSPTDSSPRSARRKTMTMASAHSSPRLATANTSRVPSTAISSPMS
ncbi:hypothetical protein LTS18_009806, partial [Coniosporium uncinatum]